MEHRNFNRAAVAADVAIYCSGTFAARGKIRNISQDGMFIECASAVCPTHICVEVDFLGPGKCVTDEQRVFAYIVHRAEEGIGLMLVMPGKKLLRSLSELTRDHFRQGSQPDRVMSS